MYSLTIASAAERLFKKLPREVKARLIEEAQVLKTEPMKGESLKGKYRTFRSLHLAFKGTQYRIIYQVFTDAQMVTIRLAAPRENIYRRLEEMMG